MDATVMNKSPSNSSMSYGKTSLPYGQKDLKKKLPRSFKMRSIALAFSIILTLALSIVIGAGISFGNSDETTNSTTVSTSANHSTTTPPTSAPPTTVLIPRIDWKASVDLVPTTNKTPSSSSAESSVTETTIIESKEFEHFESFCKVIEHFFFQYVNLNKTGSITFSDELGFDYERWIYEKEKAPSLYERIIACKHLVEGSSNLISKQELANLYIDYALEIEEKEEYYNAETYFDAAILLLLDLASYKNSPIVVSDIAFRLGDIYEHKSLISNDNESFFRLLYTSGAYYKIATECLHSCSKTLYSAKYALYYGTILLRVGLIMDKPSSSDIRWFKAAESQYHQALRNDLSSVERTRCLNELKIIKERLYPFASSLD